MIHKIVIEIEDEKLWKALSGLSAVTHHPISKVITDVYNFKDMCNQFTKKIINDNGAMMAIKRNKLDQPLLDMCALLEEK